MATDTYQLETNVAEGFDVDICCFVDKSSTKMLLKGQDTQFIESILKHRIFDGITRKGRHQASNGVWHLPIEPEVEDNHMEGVARRVYHYGCMHAYFERRDKASNIKTRRRKPKQLNLVYK